MSADNSNPKQGRSPRPDPVENAAAPSVAAGQAGEDRIAELPDLQDLPEPDDAVTAFWDGAGIDPVLITLPGGSGLTLRHYQHVVDADVNDDLDGLSKDDEDHDDEDQDDEDGVPPTIDANEIEPRFLGDGGRIYVFGTPEDLVQFVHGDAPHALADAPGWATVRQATDLDPTPQLLNRYELDLVVDIARAGGDGWGQQEKQALLLAGELARDAAAFCLLADVQAMLAPGSPLDSLDDDLRADGFLARRRLRRYNTDQIALSWRRIIREISTCIEQR